MVDDPDRPRDAVLGRLYDHLKKAQSWAEIAGLNQMALAIREMRRQTHVALTLANNDSDDPEIRR